MLELPTPVLVVDQDLLDRNIAAMAGHADRQRVSLRPHAKTHKSLDVARRQLAAGAVGLTVATVGEAEVFAQVCDDLFVAYPLWLDSDKAHRLQRVLERAAVTVGVDSAEAARTLVARLGESRAAVSVLVEVDSGHRRSGVAPEDAGQLAEVVAHTGLTVRGVFTFPGHSYAPSAPPVVAAQESDALARAAGSLRRHGIVAEVVSGGSTPTAGLTGGGPLTELRPGVYVFGDAQQVELGTTTLPDVALTALATVVSRRRGEVVLDAGSKVLGTDRPGWASGYGRLPDHPDARVTSLSEHHAVVSWDAAPLPEVGDALRVVPNHVCTAVNLAETLVVVRGGAVVDEWPVHARGRNR